MNKMMMDVFIRCSSASLDEGSSGASVLVGQVKVPSSLLQHVVCLLGDCQQQQSPVCIADSPPPPALSMAAWKQTNQIASPSGPRSRRSSIRTRIAKGTSTWGKITWRFGKILSDDHIFLNKQNKLHDWRLMDELLKWCKRSWGRFLSLCVATQKWVERPLLIKSQLLSFVASFLFLKTAKIKSIYIF